MICGKGFFLVPKGNPRKGAPKYFVELPMRNEPSSQIVYLFYVIYSAIFNGT